MKPVFTTHADVMTVRLVAYLHTGHEACLHDACRRGVAHDDGEVLLVPSVRRLVHPDADEWTAADLCLDFCHEDGSDGRQHLVEYLRRVVTGVPSLQ